VNIYDEPAPYVSPGEVRARYLIRAALVVAAVAGLLFASFVVARAVAEAALGQCAPPWLTGTDPQLCLNAQVSQRQLTISGTTSLPDRAVLTLWAEDYGTSYGEYWQTETVAIPVSGGAFRWTFDVSSWGAGTVTANVQFRIGPGQPPQVVDRYGSNGEHIVGPDVELDFRAGDPPPRTVKVSVDVDLSAG
jgi:hypothetical protein